MAKGSKKFKKGWIALGFVCAGAVLFHKPLLLMGCKALLGRAIPQTAGRIVSYEKMQWEEGVIALSGLQVKDPFAEFTVDRIELKFKGDFFKLCFRPELVVVHPQMLFLSTESGQGSAVPFLYRTRWIQPRWEVRNGVLQLPSTSRFYFSMAPGGEEGSMGKLHFSHDPNPQVLPLFSADLSAHENTLQVGFQLNEMDISRLLPLTGLLFADVPRKWERASGEVEFVGLLCLDDSLRVKELHCHGAGKQISLTGMGIDVHCEEINGAFSYPDGESHLQLSGVFQQVPFVISGKGGVQSDSAYWSEVALSLTELQAEAAMHGKEITFQVKGDAKELFSLFAGVNDASLPIELKATGMIEKGDIKLQGQGLVADEPFQGTAVFSASSLTLKEGKLQAEHLTQKSYGVFIPLFSPGAHLTGNLNAEATFSPARIQVSLSGDALVLNHPAAEFSLPDLKSAQFSYSPTDKRWRGAIPLFAAKLKTQGLSFEQIEGNLKWEGGHLKGVGLYAECEGLAMRGTVDLSDENFILSTSQIAGDVQSLFSVLRHFPAVPQVEIPITGNFSSGDKDFCLNLPQGSEAEWSFKGSFDHLSFPVNAATSMTDGRCSIAFDSKAKNLIVEKGEGTWTLMDGTAFSVQLKRLQLSEQMGLDVALKVVDGKKEFALFEGKAKPTGEIQFEPQTHFCGTQLNISRCLLNDAMQLTSFEMKPTLKCQDFHRQAAFLQNAGFLAATFSPKNIEKLQLEGTVEAQIFSEDFTKGFSLHGTSSDLKVKGKALSSFQLKAKRMGEKWLIEHLEAGDVHLKGAFIVEGDTLIVPQFEGDWEGILMKGSGSVNTEEKCFSCNFESLKGDFPKGTFVAGVNLTGDFSDSEDPLKLTGDANLFIDIHAPLPIGASNKKKVKFTYGKANGLVCEGIDFQLKHKISGRPLGDMRAAKLQKFQAGDLFLQQLELSLSPALLGHCIDAKLIHSSFKELEWDGNLEVSGDVKVSQGTPVFQGTLKPGRYGYAGRSLPFEHVQLRYEKQLLGMKIKTEVQQLPLWSLVQVDLADEPFGAVQFFDAPKAEGLKLLFTTHNGILSWESVQGSCYGICCSLAKAAKNKLSGEIFVDGNEFALLLPKEIKEGIQSFKLGKGYQWKGDLTLWQESERGFSLTGLLKGRDFEAFGYHFSSLSGNLQVSPKHVLITDIKIDDQAGRIGIKKIELNKEEEWTLKIPQVSVAELQPCLMRKVDGEEQPIKPFTIKNFTLTDITGRLGDKSSLEGSGHLTFTNQSKKEASLLDIPLEMIKKIGLDPGLLTPVHGELQMELRGDKFYLVALENSFSEGERAEFYLSPEHDLSFIDLEGKVNINLKMRQDVMLKITEPFTLTIRGTLEKPRYGLQY